MPDEPCGSGARPRVLIAGVGNSLRGDDGFGPLALKALEKLVHDSRLSLSFYETGIAGISLVQKLMDGYDALIILDALDRSAPPGQVFVLEHEHEKTRLGPKDAVDPHLANPHGVVRLAFALGILPPKVWIIGCQAGECDELSMELSPSVAKAVPVVVERVQRVLENLAGSTAPEPERESSMAAVDEILQVLYWLSGEGLATEATAREVARFVSLPETEISSLFERMTSTGLLEPVPDAGSPASYRLTELGAREGRRRFADEFADFTKPGHGECGDPSCDCRETGDPADCRFA